MFEKCLQSLNVLVALRKPHLFLGSRSGTFDKRKEKEGGEDESGFPHSFG